MEKEPCIFCQIANKEIPCDKIYEDEKFLVFLDIKPITDGHLLVIPKKHVVWMQEADDETIGEIFKLSKKMMLALKKGMACDYVQVGVVGNEVPHFHIHLAPRYNDIVWPNLPTTTYKDNEPAELVRKITQAL